MVSGVDKESMGFDFKNKEQGYGFLMDMENAKG